MSNWSQPEYGGPERRSEPSEGEEAFERAVRSATAAATQAVSRVHRIRLVTQAFVAAFAVSAAMGTGLGYVFKNEEQTQASAESVANCRLVRSLSSVMSDFVGSDVAVRNKQARANVVVTVAKHLRLPASDLAALQRANDLGFAVARHWTEVDRAKLDALARVNCATGLP